MLCFQFIFPPTLHGGFPDGTKIKNPSANAGDARDLGSIPVSGKSPRVGNGNPLQYCCLENSTDRGAWWATVHGVAGAGHDRVHTHNSAGGLPSLHHLQHLLVTFG